MSSIPPGTYTLDAEKLKLNAYRLLCLFYATMGIARTSDPEKPNDAAATLERQFSSREMTVLLLSIAIGVRVTDGWVIALPSDNKFQIEYIERRDLVNAYWHCMMFNIMPLREVRNKIIHAVVVEPHSTPGSGSHQIDEHNWHGWSEARDQSPDDVGPEPEPIE
jgi:hypothetical protein